MAARPGQSGEEAPEGAGAAAGLRDHHSFHLPKAQLLIRAQPLEAPPVCSQSTLSFLCCFAPATPWWIRQLTSQSTFPNTLTMFLIRKQVGQEFPMSQARKGSCKEIKNLGQQWHLTPRQDMSYSTTISLII